MSGRCGDGCSVPSRAYFAKGVFLNVRYCDMKGTVHQSRSYTIGFMVMGVCDVRSAKELVSDSVWHVDMVAVSFVH